MSKNARQIDYRLRLGKYVERRMMCTAFQKLSLFYPLSKYKYIGFGAYYFSDFYLFHKELGIEKMLSIEKSNSNEVKLRYEFNKPFNCIDIDFRESSIVLPEIEWDTPSIIWLDYTSCLTSDIVADIATTLRRSLSGSIISFTLKIDSDFYKDNESIDSPIKISETQVYVNKVGKEYAPREISKKDLTPKFLHTVYTRTINNIISKILFERNASSMGENIEWVQLFNFKYADGVTMYTIGGILVQGESHKARLDDIDFDRLQFIRRGEEQFEIAIPNLTIKEIKYLEGIMPYGINADGSIKGEYKVKGNDPSIPTNDILNFAKIYKYFPTFTESRL
ncbi:hypothetical protein QWY85_10190 [Neolewinella lacunae]|uniref:Uncharacterized protein n=1 Tax=Neolewinella lacunae TaxID=1517758 RepID=A0A923T9U5_9BACT|nr:O-methyltransferase [Neolewinella lacunae]MBC6995443.1 hypothetical protein [Neolewinella lacunae]MDN3635030.1 hypothetical protein [Neolewinella lacunae]